MRQHVCDLLTHSSQLEFCLQIVDAAFPVGHLLLFRRRRVRRSAQRPGLQVGQARLQHPGPQPMEHGFVRSPADRKPHRP